MIMENILIIHSICGARQSCGPILITQGDGSSLDIIYKIAMIFIAGFNVAFAIYIFGAKNRIDKVSNESNRKISLLKTLVLDYGLDHFYTFFDNIDKETQKLHDKGLSITDGKEICDSLFLLGKIFRQKFADTFLAIDKNLYEGIIKNSDHLIDNITELIFDDKVVLSNMPIFDEKITKEISSTKTSIIKLLFNYKGV